MDRTIIVPVIKSPHSSGRIGPEAWQDWYNGVRKAVSISRHKTGSDLLVLSNAQYRGKSHETDLYYGALTKLGVTADANVNIRIIREGYETIEQIDRSFELADEEGKELVFISTFSHYPRVQWLIWRCKSLAPSVRVKHRIVFGIPRPREMLSDIVLAILFPLVDLCGGRKWFLKKVERRRLKGKL